jgi:transcription initiation factor IIE alpha subunit
MEHEILDLIDRYWKFDNDQTPVSNWHDKQDLLEAVRKALRIHDVVGRSEQLACVHPYGKVYQSETEYYCEKCGKDLTEAS